MNLRRLKILEVFLSNTYLTSKELSIVLDLSEKTIRNEIKNINKCLEAHNIEIQSKMGIGYTLFPLNNETRSKIIDLYFSDDYSSQIAEIEKTEKRREDVIVEILFSDYLNNRKTSFEKLKDQLFLSNSPVIKTIGKLQKELEPKGISIVKRNDKIWIEGNEQDIRFRIADYIYNERKNNKFFMETVFDGLDIEKLKEVVEDILVSSEYQITDYAFNNLMTHIFISLKRNRFVASTISQIDSRSNREVEITRAIINKMGNKFQVDISSEFNYIYQVLVSTQKFGIVSSQNVTNRTIVSAIELGVKAIKEQTGLDFADDFELFNGLAVHLDVAINRMKTNMSVRNDFLTTIKASYPLSFDLSVIFCNIIVGNFNIDINDDEIGLIAIHFGAALAKKANQGEQKQLKVVIVCTYGIALANLIKQNLRSMKEYNFSKIDIINSSSFSYENYGDYDFVISTTQLLDVPNKKLIITKDFSLDLIESHLSGISTDIGEDNNFIENLFDERLYFKSFNATNKKEVLDYIAEIMMSLNYLSKSDYQSLLAREEFSSTEIGNNIATPHVITQGEVSKITVLVLNEAIIWNTNMVKVVFFMVISKNDVEIFEQNFRQIYKLISDKVEVARIITSYHFVDFVNALKRMPKTSGY